MGTRWPFLKDGWMDSLSTARHKNRQVKVSARYIYLKDGLYSISLSPNLIIRIPPVFVKALFKIGARDGSNSSWIFCAREGSGKGGWAGQKKRERKYSCDQGPRPSLRERLETAGIHSSDNLLAIKNTLKRSDRSSLGRRMSDAIQNLLGIKSHC